MSIRLDWNNEQSEQEITEAWIHLLERLLKTAGEMENVKKGVVSLSFVTDEAIQELNKQYRKLDRSTDVLSFPMDEPDDEAEMEKELGDIIISIPTAKRQCLEYNHSLEREVGFLFIHGFLHLLGYDHQETNTEQEMFERQEKILLKAGLNR